MTSSMIDRIVALADSGSCAAMASSTALCAGRLALRPLNRLVKRIDVRNAVETSSSNCAKNGLSQARRIAT